MTKGIGKHGLIESRNCDGQWGKMPGDLKQKFKEFYGQLDELLGAYKAWFLQVGTHDPKGSQDFIPNDIDEQLELFD